MNKHHSQCPECRTVFTVTDKQLAQRKGLVRCGRCDAVFQADQNFVDLTVTGKAAQKPDTTTVPGKTEADSGAPAKKEPVTSQQTDSPSENQAYQTPLPTVSELIHGRKLGARTRPVFWGMAIILMAILLAGQWMYFNRDELARDKQWAPYVQLFCASLHCTITPRHDVGLVELADTRVTPHPKFDKALRVKATLINRARYTQPYPLMEVTLTDTEGKVLARKRFHAKEYLKNNKQVETGLVPNVAHKAQMEITSPETTADGYEIRLLPSV
jgi:predicted Zn finger-like uncharacterized protein